MRLKSGIVGLCLLGFSLSVSANKVAIIIDDIGYRHTDREAVLLDGKISVAVLPHTPFGRELAVLAHKTQKDVLLHIPMEASNGKRLGPGGLTSNMRRQELNAILTSALMDIPFARGVNNHMGSKLTQLSTHMRWTMDFLKQHQLYFLDSKTTPMSVAGDVARQHGVATLSRHIFLDHFATPSFIHKQFQKIKRTARYRKQLIVIGHPYPETIAYLQKHLWELEANGIDLVGLESLVPDSIDGIRLAARNTAQEE